MLFVFILFHLGSLVIFMEKPLTDHIKLLNISCAGA